MAEITSIDHSLTVLWDPGRPDLGTLDIYARELHRNPDLPALLFLQGGPGNPAPRPTEIAGWIDYALNHYRVILLDQRGTGRSTRLDRYADPSLLDLSHLTRLGANFIVDDAEALRSHLGIAQWDVLGQSFGGFCLLNYLSRYPDSIRRGMFTGGLAATGATIDEVYASTFRHLQREHETFYAAYPGAEAMVRAICAHLDTYEEYLPTGERLTSRRFRTVGSELGQATGFASLAALLEAPFHRFAGTTRLRGDFLAAVGERVSFERAPLYAVVHEAIYGGVTAWSAERVSRTVAGFAPDADPHTADRFYLTGEHIFPFQFDEDPALRPFRGLAHAIASHDFGTPHDSAALARADVPLAAAVYPRDIYVPVELSLATASSLPHIDVWMADHLHHDGIRRAGADVLRELLGRLDA